MWINHLLISYLFSSTIAFASCSDVTLTDADKKVLNKVKRLEEVGGVANGLIVWSPVVLVMTAGAA